LVKIFQGHSIFGLKLFSKLSLEWLLYTNLNRRPISCKFCIYFHQKLKKILCFQFFLFFIKNFTMEIFLWSWNMFAMIHEVLTTYWWNKNDSNVSTDFFASKTLKNFIIFRIVFEFLSFIFNISTFCWFLTTYKCFMYMHLIN
jgi:hypothetical protein